MRGVNILEIRLLGLGALLLLLLISSPCASQKSTKTINILEFKYGLQLPMGDMKDRFGVNNSAGINFQSVSLDKKWLWGIEGSFLFGSTIKEDVLTLLRTYDGSIIGINGKPGDINLKERGFYLGLNAGKIFSTGANENKLTGIRLEIGGGLLQHKIRVQDNLNSIVALEKKYLKGYDRLSNGPAIHLGLGYHYQSPINNLHFHIMGDLYGARTVSRRDFDYATGQYLEKKRLDILAGISLAYIVTISRLNKPEHIYY